MTQPKTWVKEGGMSDEFKAHIDALCHALKTDQDYRWSWQANIAMVVWDAIRDAGFQDDARVLHRACNKGASNFLNLLCRERDQ